MFLSEICHCQAKAAEYCSYRVLCVRATRQCAGRRAGRRAGAAGGAAFHSATRRRRRPKVRLDYPTYSLFNALLNVTQMAKFLHE